MSKYHVRITDPESGLGKPAIAKGSQSVIIQQLIKMGFGVEEMARGEKKDMVRVTLGQDREV